VDSFTVTYRHTLKHRKINIILMIGLLSVRSSCRAHKAGFTLEKLTATLNDP